MTVAEARPAIVPEEETGNGVHRSDGIGPRVSSGHGHRGDVGKDR
jgi:hypothetical protein